MFQGITSSDDDDLVFETNPPPNLYRLRPGDAVFLHDPFVVERVGYRKRGRDYQEEAADVLREIYAPLVSAARQALHREASIGGNARRALLNGLANALAYMDGFGGAERGVWLRPEESRWSPSAPGPRRKGRVEAVRSHSIGTYYPPSGGSGGTYDGEWDSPDPGGLANQRTVIVASVRDERGRLADRLAGHLRYVDKKCSACDPDGWECERGPHPPGTLHAIGLPFGEEPKPDPSDPGSYLNADRAWRGTTRWRETNNHVLDYLYDHPGASDAGVGQALGLTAATVRRHRKILLDEGMIPGEVLRG